MHRSLTILSLGISIGPIAASLYWREAQKHSKFLFDQNVKCQQIAKQYQAENSVAVLKIAYSSSRNSCVAEVARPQKGSMDLTVDDLLSGDQLFFGHCTVEEFLDKEKFKALGKDQDAKFSDSVR